MANYNILYQGRKIYLNLSAEECAEVLEDMSQTYYENNLLDPELIELEEIGDW
jgi:hypothetical protein